MQELFAQLFWGNEDVSHAVVCLCEDIPGYHSAKTAYEQVLSQVRDDPSLNGLEKLRTIFKVSMQPERQAKMFSMMPYLLDNAKFLAMEMRSIFQEVVPIFMEPIIRQGIADGSIRTDHPKELAEIVILLSDMWINPVVQPTSPEDIRARCAVYNRLFLDFGIPELIDQELLDLLVKYAEMPHPPSPNQENRV